MSDRAWQFAIDMGGTFCDVVGVSPDGGLHTLKLLSSGRFRGRCAGGGGDRVVDPARAGDPAGFWDGSTVWLIDERGAGRCQRVVRAFDAREGVLLLDGPLGFDPTGMTYELGSGQEAPVLGIRYVLGLKPGEVIPPCSVRLGTTRGTNALLERRGGRVAFVVTEGLGDLLLIGDQSRPKLFDLDIAKPSPLHDCVIEAAERLDASGSVVAALDVAGVRERLAAARSEGVEAVAVCLLNAYRNDVHERAVAEVARSLGFSHVCTSVDLAAAQRIVPRAQSCVVDAYLAPVFRAYLHDIAKELPGSRLRLMTGAGGLVGARRFSGVSSILSGPAGGLVGAVHVARRAGFARVITFDMGGTSTDVARFDGAFEYQQETVKAGVRVLAPMLAIETVAAGGGSVCRFDGFRFQVGPESAGTDPGPACYGRGGPLTLTDVNVHLGRVPVDGFPFALDCEAVVRRLEELSVEVLRGTGRRMSHEAMADGFVRVANANMVAAIRRITVERGIDARDHALVCFGGAGGQHACAVARALGVGKIVAHRLAGLLSACGIAMGDVKRFAERPVHGVYDRVVEGELREAFASLKEALVEELRADGVSAGDIAFERFLDMRYVGQASVLTVSAEAAADGFRAAHKREFGYVHDDRDIEVTAVRVQATARTAMGRLSPVGGRGRMEADGAASVVFEDGAHEARVIDGSALRAGETVDGPTVVAEATSTLVIDAGWRAEVNADGDLVLTDVTGGGECVGAGSTEADPVRLELFNNHFAAIAEQMGVVLRRTALSTNVKERLDFSCAVFTGEGDLIANAPHIPVHVGSMGACVKGVMRCVGEMGRGDVVVTNDPFTGGTHLPDVTVVTPVFIGDACRFFVASRAHHAEIGGRRPGSMPADATCLADEGVVIPPFKIVADGVARFDELGAVLRGAEYPSRCADENLADMAAQVAANKAGVDALRGLVDAQGVEVVCAFAAHVRRTAAAKMREAIAKLPDGAHAFCDALDDGTPIAVRVTIRGDEATVDFTGTGVTQAGNLNATPAIVDSAVLYCFRCLIDEDIPLNAGVLDPIRVVLPRCLLNPERHDSPARCAAVAGGNVETSQRVVDVVFGALGVAAGSQGTMNNVVFGNERFAYYETVCGGAGAGPRYDGAHAVHTHMTNTRLTDPEVLEARYPVRLRRFAIRRGSGGRGRWRGGDGCVREIEFLETLDLSLITQRRTTQPYGLQGGEAGAAGRNLVVRGGGSGAVEALASTALTTVRAGDVLILETPGGGGVGVA